jgi:EAL domain-containing protein (putative c-di-GMP-specific phosphodiesterase class I)
VTAEDLAEADFAAAMAALVAEHGVAADRLTLEVTERGLIEDPERASQALAALRQQGFRIAIDDFGTGYSSLAYLSQLPLDYLKLDRVLTQDIAGSGRDRTVVKGVIELAHSLGLVVIAEGVETEQQRDLLARAGVELWQGFLCAGPVSADQLAAFASPRAS